VPTNKQRREAARRHLERQLQQRQASETARKKRVLIATIAGTLVLALVVVLFVVFVTQDSGKKTPAAAAATTPRASASASAAAAKYPCSWHTGVGGAAARKVALPPTTPPKTGTVVVDVATTRGPMVFTLDRAKAPCTVANFESLAKQKYFDNTPCHRLETSSIYVLQCGDPSGKGTGGPGYSIPDEYTGGEKYTRGTLAMANTGQANTGGSQFFIVYKDDTLPAQYTVFGKVSSGLGVVDKVAAAGSNNANGAGDGAPKLATSLKTVRVKTG
jgi:peptidyl-prolyl cis-trans isomerase B (cyclophilin B)